jgi:glycolate oxidase FAD binding subunit
LCVQVHILFSSGFCQMIRAPSILAAALESILDASSVFSDPTTCADYAIDEVIPSVIAKPSSAEQVAEIVRFVVLEKLALLPCGARTKLCLGPPPTRYDIALDMTALNKISHYDPADLTLSVEAGAVIAKLNAALIEHQQFLPLLVPWYSLTTVGGTLASGIDSPLRQFYGTHRDFLIGAEFIDGTGKLCKSGGRVVKNVTGYDLHKLLIGSLGTLAVITRLNFRTFPAPITGSLGLVASFPDAEGALALRHTIAQSPLTPLTFDIVSPGLAQIFSQQSPTTPETAVFAGENRSATEYSLPTIGDWFHPQNWQLCAAFAGPPEVLARYKRDFSSFATESRAASIAILDDSTRPSLWGRLRESLSMLRVSSPAATIFKLSVLPSNHAALFTKLQDIATQASLPHALVARASGTVYFALLPTSANGESTASLAEPTAQTLESVSAANGHATILFAPTALKHAANVASDSARCVLRPTPTSIDLRLKSAFDPHTIFAPGRFSPGSPLRT